MTATQYARPMSITPPMVTPSDLNEAYWWTQRNNRRWFNAKLDGDDVKNVKHHWDTLEYCFAHYAEMRARAEPEVIAAHLRQREQQTTAA